MGDKIVSSTGKCCSSDALIEYSIGVDLTYPGCPRLYLHVDLHPRLEELRELFILHSRADVYFIRDPGGGEARIPFKLEHPVYAAGSTTLRYYLEDSLRMISYLEDFRRGANLKVAIDISIEGFIMEKRMIEGRHYTLPVKRYTISCANRANQAWHLLVTREHWYENILKYYNYPRRIAVELPLGAPPAPIIKEADEILKEFCERLRLAQKKIEEGWKAVYMGDEIGRYQAIVKAREALELVDPGKIAETLGRNPHDVKQTLRDILLIKTGTTTSNIAEEVYRSLEAIQRNTKNIADKGPHAVTRKGETMEYHPEHIDAETLLTTATAIIRYYKILHIQNTKILQPNTKNETIMYGLGLNGSLSKCK